MTAEITEIPIGLRTLAAELDALGGVSNGPAMDALPDLEGSDFRPLALIGRGGMGEVYVARQLSLDREVAVKVISSTRARDGEFRTTLMEIDRSSPDLRQDELERALKATEALQARFPDNAEIRAAVERLCSAIEWHKNLPPARTGRRRMPLR